MLYKIESFAHDLNAFAEANQFSFLQQYAAEITDELEIVDLEALKSSMKAFPGMVEEISSFIKK
ncbi:MAG: hypothetical protein HC896_01805 [Bacteroidales bacterium]|nr:hypothetical protein [Bacteroidales bacterium]